MHVLYTPVHTTTKQKGGGGCIETISTYTPIFKVNLGNYYNTLVTWRASYNFIFIIVHNVISQRLYAMQCQTDLFCLRHNDVEHVLMVEFVQVYICCGTKYSS